MSIKIQTQVWELDLGHTDLMILLAMADHANDFGRCYPSVRYLAWKTSYSERQVQRTIKRLSIDKPDGVGKILVPIAYQNGGRGRATEYMIDTTKGDTKAPFKTDKRVTSTTQKGDIQSIKGDIQSVKGDIATSPQSSGTINNHQEPFTSSTKKTRRVVELTPEVIEKIAKDYPHIEDLNFEIDVAMNHKSALNYTDMNLYVRNWLNKLGDRPIRQSTPRRAAPNKDTSDVTRYAEFEETLKKERGN